MGITECVAIAMLFMVGGYLVGKRFQLESDSTYIYCKFQKIINELRISQLPDSDYCNGIKHTIDVILTEFGLERDKEPIC